MSDLPRQCQGLGCDAGDRETRALGVWHRCRDLVLIWSPYTGTGEEHMDWVIRL